MERVKLHGGKSIDRVERYGLTIRDEPGTLQMIPKRDLHIDKTYQRQAHKNKVVAIRADWSWVACGALVVGRRPSGTLVVVDGQHRKLAADGRSDIQALPCIVFDISGIKDEAQGFIAVNTLRKSMSAFDKYRALLVSGDAEALAVESLVSSHGMRVSASSSPGSVKCISALLRAHRVKRAHLVRIWHIIAEMAKADNGLSVVVFQSLLYIEEKAQESGQTISSPAWTDRIVSLGQDLLARSARSIQAQAGKGGAKVWSMGILREMNKGLRTKKLRIAISVTS